MVTKRQKMPKSWPIARKGTKYVAVASHAKGKSVPLLFVLRDILGIAKTRKEARYFLLKGNVSVNNKVRRNDAFPIQVFDVVQLSKMKKNYRLEIVNRKFTLKEISDGDANKKIVKISGKKILEKGKIQMNLEDGQNILTDEKFSTGDSVVLNTKEDKIEKILPLKDGANVEVILGKHAGEKGELKTIENLEKGKIYVIKLSEKEVRLPGKTLIVIA